MQKQPPSAPRLQATDAPESADPAVPHRPSGGLHHRTRAPRARTVAPDVAPPPVAPSSPVDESGTPKPLDPDAPLTRGAVVAAVAWGVLTGLDSIEKKALAEIARVNAEVTQLRAEVATYVGTYGDRRFDCGQLTADRIVIPGPDGKPAITLGVNTEGPFLKMASQDKQGSLEVSIGDGAPAILLSRGDCDPGISVQVLRDELMGGKWVPRIEVWRDESAVNLGFIDEDPSLSLTQDGVVMFDLCSNTDGSGMAMRFEDSKEKERLRVGLGLEGAPLATFSDRDGDPLVRVGLEQNGDFVTSGVPYTPGVIVDSIDAIDCSKHARAIDALTQALEDTCYTMNNLRALKTRVKAVFRARQAEIENGGQQ